MFGAQRDVWGGMAEQARPKPSIEQRAAVAARESLSAWMRRIGGITLEHRPLDFERRPWLRELYDDVHPRVVLLKSTQVGGSCWSILRCLHLARVMPGWRGWGYWFPTLGDVLDFSQTRVSPLIEQNEALRSQIGTLDKAGVRQFAQGYIYFRGMRSKTGMKSFPADGLVFDELDEAPPESKKIARERLGASPYKYELELSNPTLPGWGIDLSYSGNADIGDPGSDQRAWFIRCEACNEWTCMEAEFPQELGRDDLVVIRARPDADGYFRPGSWFRCCSRCGAEIDPGNGQWVRARQDDYLPHGYRLSQLYQPTIDPAAIAQEYHESKFPRQFYNLKIGIAWVDAQDRLAVEDVERNCTAGGMSYVDPGPCTMGVDQGSHLHVTITRWSDLPGLRQVVYLGVHRNWSDLDELWDRYNCMRAVVDALPEQHMARAFAMRHQGKVFMNFYIETHTGRPKWDESDYTVKCNRTEVIDAARSVLRGADRSARLSLPRSFDVVREFAKHNAALMKKREEDAQGNVRFTYVHTAPDHYAHSFVYDCLCWLFEVSPSKGPAVGQGITMTSTDGRGGRGGAGGYITNPEHPEYVPPSRRRF